jgi:hypothetical protein
MKNEKYILQKCTKMRNCGKNTSGNKRVFYSTSIQREQKWLLEISDEMFST